MTPKGRPIRRLRVPFAQMARDDPGELRGRISWWIRTGRIVHPAMEAVRAIHGPGIVWLPIADLQPLSSALVWLRGEPNDRAREFARVAREVLEHRGADHLAAISADPRAHAESTATSRASAAL